MLTNRQQLFVQEYLVDLNATQAALRAGYSPKTAHQINALSARGAGLFDGGPKVSSGSRIQAVMRTGFLRDWKSSTKRLTPRAIALQPSKRSNSSGAITGLSRIGYA